MTGKRSSQSRPGTRSRKGPGTPHQGPLQTRYIVMLLVLGMGYWWWKKQQAPAPLIQMPAQQRELEPQLLRPEAMQKQQKQEQKRSLLFAQERAAGLQPLPVQITPNNIQLQVSSTLLLRRCIIGDFDIMLRDQQILKRPDPGFILSLENLDPQSFVKPLQVPLSIKQMKQGIQHTFTLPQQDKRSTWGLFICTKGQQPSCAQQSKPSLAQLSAQQGPVLASSPEAQYDRSEKVFFFHFIVAYQDRLLMHDPLQSLDTSFQRLELALNQAGGKSVSPSLLNEVKQWYRKIGSMPAFVKSGGIQIQLPHQGEGCS